MLTKTGLAIALSAAFLTLPVVSARADEVDQVARLDHLHEACKHEDKRACIEFGAMLERYRMHEEEWRRDHPGWYWWRQ